MIGREQIAQMFSAEKVTEAGYDALNPKIQTLMAQFAAFGQYLDIDLLDGPGKAEALSYLQESFLLSCKVAQPAPEPDPVQTGETPQ